MFKERYIDFLVLIICSVFLALPLSGQEVIAPYNPSFEGKPRKGDYSLLLSSWMDCMFHRGETPPDVHSFSTNFFDVKTAPMDRQTFLGMVARETETNEAVSQQLPAILKKDRCYEMSIFLAHDANYKSPINIDRIMQDSSGRSISPKKSFANPIKLIIWGGSSYCMRSQKLVESPAVKDTVWKEYVMQFSPEEDYQYITLEAYWNTPVLTPYNGNILLDKMSSIVQINCDNELAKVEILDFDPSEIDKEQNIEWTDVSGNQDRTSSGGTSSDLKEAPVEKKIKEVSGMRVEEFIQSSKELTIRDLIFDADTFSIQPESFKTLDEIYFFMEENPRIYMDVIGHTNSLPPHDFCDRLSLKRAEAVKQYLVEKGVEDYRLNAIGYGKRKPLVSNKTSVGRERNQRVEIKITRR